MKYSQDDANLVFIESKGFDTKTAEGLQKALKWVQTVSSDYLLYGEPTGDPFDIAMGEMRRPMLIDSVKKALKK